MSFSLEGALAGVGKGMQASAGLLESKYARDFQSNENKLQYQRQEALTKLKNGFDVEAAKTLNTNQMDLQDRKWANDKAVTNSANAREDAQYSQKRIDTKVDQQSALDMASEYKDAETQEKLASLRSIFDSGGISEEAYNAVATELTTGIKMPTSTKKALTTEDLLKLKKLGLEVDALESKAAGNTAYSPEEVNAATNSLKNSEEFISGNVQEQQEMTIEVLQNMNPNVSKARVKEQYKKLTNTAKAYDKAIAKGGKDLEDLATSLSQGNPKAENVYNLLKPESQEKVDIVIKQIEAIAPVVEEETQGALGSVQGKKTSRGTKGGSPKTIVDDPNSGWWDTARNKNKEYLKRN